MAHVIELTDEQYAAVERAAQQQGVTPEAYVAMIAQAESQPRRIYDDLDDWFRSLGMTDEEIAESDQIYEELYGSRSGTKAQISGQPDADL